MGFGEGTPPAALGDYTGFLLNWLAARSRTRFADAVGEVGLHRTQFAALSVIAAKPGLSQQELVGETGIDPSTMVATIDSLERAGLAERRPHARDRRKRELHLTPDGEKALAEGQAIAARIGDELFARLSPSERAQLHVLLRRAVGLEAGDEAAEGATPTR